MVETKTCLLYPPKASLKGTSHSVASYKTGKCLISSLSLDIFSLIAAFLSTEDIRCARLSGRELHFFSSPYLIRALSLTNFESNNWKKKPELFHNLRTLCLDLHRYPAPSVTYHSQSFKVLSVNTPEDNLVKVLEIFPKITSVILFNGPCNDFRCSHECRCTWTPDCPLLDRRLKGHAIDKSLLIILFKAVAKFPQLKISQIAIQGHWTRAPYKDNCDFQDDWHIPGSIKNCHQDDFKTARQWIERRPRIQYDAFHDLTSEHLALTISTFQNLTHLDVLLEPDPDIPQGGWDGWDYDTYPAVKPRWGDVPKVLEALTSLTHLSLDLSIHRHVDQQLSYVNIHDDLDVLFDGLTFPKLKTLKLAHFRSTTAILSALLQRHSGIKHLSLIEVIEIVLPAHDHYRISVWRNLNPEAEQLIEDIRALPLERLHLTGIETFGSPYHLAGGENHDLHLSRILDYTLHGYGGNPVTMAGLEECLEMDEELWDSHAWDVWNVEYSKKERMELKRWKGYLSQWQYDAVKEARRDTEGTRQARRDAEDVRGIKEDEELALWEWSLLDQEGY